MTTWTESCLFGNSLFIAGGFSINGDLATIAKWDGTTLTNLSQAGYESAFKSMLFLDDGHGPFLYAATGNTKVVKWDGHAWSQVGSELVNNGCGPEVMSLAVFNDGSGEHLYVGGLFDETGNSPSVNLNGIARLNGQAWEPVGGGLGPWQPWFCSWIKAMTVFDDGTGPALYVGGSFDTAGGQTMNSIAKWTGTQWQPLGQGFRNGNTPGYIEALAVFNDGTGPALIAGGQFTNSGGQPLNDIAKWNGNAWSALGSGTNGEVRAFTNYDDGTGSALFAGGTFTQAGGISALKIAKWDGLHWSALGNGLGATNADEQCQALQVFDDGKGPALYAGGYRFSAAPFSGTHCLGQWRCPVVLGDVDRNGVADGNDVAPFVSMLLDPGEASADQCTAADVNRDGVVNDADISAFAARLLFGCGG